MELTEISIYDLAKQNKAYKEEIDELKNSLEKLRKNNESNQKKEYANKNHIPLWELNIELDERLSVKLLYKELVKKREAYNIFINKIVTYN